MLETQTDLPDSLRNPVDAEGDQVARALCADQLPEESTLLEATVASTSAERQKEVDSFVRSITKTVANHPACHPASRSGRFRQYPCPTRPELPPRLLIHGSFDLSRSWTSLCHAVSRAAQMEGDRGASQKTDRTSRV